jgi:transcriptional regulator with XRE-family HTH domain
MPETKQKLGDVIRRLRTERGISQEGLAAISGIDRTFMGEIERGEVNPSFDVLQRIASGLSVRLSEVIREYESENE